MTSRQTVSGPISSSGVGVAVGSGLGVGVGLGVGKGVGVAVGAALVGEGAGAGVGVRVGAAIVGEAVGAVVAVGAGAGVGDGSVPPPQAPMVMATVRANRRGMGRMHMVDEMENVPPRQSEDRGTPATAQVGAL